MRCSCLSPLVFDDTAPYGTGTSRPFASTIDAMDSYLFRRRKLRVHGNVVADLGTGDHTYSFDFTLNSKLEDEPHGLAERSPVAGVYGFDTGKSLEITSDDMAETRSFTFGLSVGVGAIGDEVEIRKVGSSRYVPFLFGVSTGDIDDTTYASDLSDLSGATLTFDGIAITMYRDLAGVFSGGTIVIEAPPTNGYFEFRKSNGTEPLRNPNTGALL